MHEATTINSFRRFLDNRETFNGRIEKEERRCIEALCVLLRRFHFDLSRAFIPQPPLGKTPPFSNGQTLSPCSSPGQQRISPSISCALTLTFSLTNPLSAVSSSKQHRSIFSIPREENGSKRGNVEGERSIKILYL